MPTNAGLDPDARCEIASFARELGSLPGSRFGRKSLKGGDFSPRPTRRALFLFLLFLAAALHIATIGWGDLYNETDGQYAGAAREMLESHQWFTPTNDGIPRLQKPLLLYWAIAVSLKIFSLNTAAVRLPMALATMASIAFTFLIGDRLGGP